MEKYALVLWWWASRWLAHIWVIEYIESHDIEIQEVAGTSMWAIIWACFALWKTSFEMKQIIKEIQFLKLVDLNLENALVSGNKVYKLLQNIYGDALIEESLIPLKIIASNFQTWEKKVFSSGKIVDAVRASISLPGIFTPFEIDGDIYIDGWVKANLPVGEVESKNIIAVSVVKEKQMIKSYRKIFSFELKKKFLGNTFDTLKKTISIIMATNEELHLEIIKKSHKNIILIKPDVSDYEYFDFLKYEEIIQLWYREAQKVFWERRG